MPDHEHPDEAEQYEAMEEGEAPLETQAQPVATAQPVQQSQAQPAQHKAAPPVGGPTKMQRLKQFVRECIRVFKITKKPNKEEFTTIVKISALGMLVIGAIGFLIHFAKTLIFG
ncbi:MAG: protein translocase SEC61 complex subunit gamma [Nanoarchaeota archaeon]